MKLYNTRTRTMETFAPLSDKRVLMYSCGPTVYDHLHIGNWSSYIRWDILVRLLEANGYELHRVMNITDVGHLVSDADEGEDKLEKGAKREGLNAWEIAQKYTTDFLDGMKKLNILPPEHMPRATEHIEEQIGLIKNLEGKGYTYTISDGVYYDTSKFPAYADFAKLDLAAQKEGARVQVNSEKRHPSDFAVWKFSPPGSTRDMEWDSPWGKGFPGWHIECSAMAIKFLGDSLDIHTGGIDHIPVHHTNEIAQSEAATGRRFANFWLHNNFLMSEGKKISKSEGNVFSLTDIAKKDFSMTDFRLFVLHSHYRSESNFTWESLAAARNRRIKLQSFADLRFQPMDLPGLDEDNFLNAYNGVLTALNDDLNTPRALAVLYEFMDTVSQLSASNHTHHQRLLESLDQLLGLDLLASHDIDDSQKSLIAKRESARRDGNFEESDQLREQLKNEGLELSDTPHGVVWSRIK